MNSGMDVGLLLCERDNVVASDKWLAVDKFWREYFCVTLSYYVCWYDTTLNNGSWSFHASIYRG